MRPLPFLVLYLAIFVGLLAAQVGLARVAPPPSDRARAAADAPEGMMALPPKPEGLGEAAAGGTGSETARLTVEGCEAMASAVRDACWQALARQTAPVDPQGALAVCERIPDEQLVEECHADVAESIAVADRALADRICTAIPSVKWRGQCHFGTGLALAEVDPVYAFGRCDHAEAFYLFCRHDVVGEVALVDADAAHALCAREEGDTLQRKTCWHGMGKYLARRSLDEAAAACRAATPEWQGNCFHGAGWGAAERDPDAALAGCATQAPFEENCTQGVAHQLKRADPERAVALCEGLATASIRERCLAFVTR